MLDNREIKIKWYNIKMYNKYNVYIWDVKETELKYKVRFWETINNGQWALDIVLNSDNYELNSELYWIKVYYVIEINNEQIEEHIYTGIISNNRRVKESKTTEKTYTFVWLYNLYNEKYNFLINNDWDDTNSISYDYIDNTDNFLFIQNNILKSVWFTEVKTSGSLVVWVTKIIWHNNWYEAHVVYFENEWWANTYMWFYKQTWRFDDNEYCDIYEYNFSTNEYEDTWDDIEILEYRSWDNIANYYLDYDTGNVSSWWTTKNIEVKSKKNDELLSYLLEFNEWTYFFVDKNGQIHFKDYETLDLNKTITFDKEALNIEDNKDNLEIKNYIIADNWTDTVIVFDNDSIEEHGRKEYKYTDTDIQDAATLSENANKILEEKKNPRREVYIRCNIKKYLINVNFTTWWEMIENWWDYTETWWNLKTEIGWGSIFNINIWDKINVRNIDYENDISDLVVTRKEFDWEFLNLYLWSYNKNYALT